MGKYQIAEINIIRMRGVNIHDPIMKEFVDNLSIVNSISEGSDGFVWRLKEDNGNATNINPYDDERLIINVSVWQHIDALEHFMYKTFHSDFLRRCKQWFQTFGKAYTAMWWIRKGEFPTIQEAVEKLDHLQKYGHSGTAFDCKHNICHLRSNLNIT